MTLKIQDCLLVDRNDLVPGKLYTVYPISLFDSIFTYIDGSRAHIKETEPILFLTKDKPDWCKFLTIDSKIIHIDGLRSTFYSLVYNLAE